MLCLFCIFRNCFRGTEHANALDQVVCGLQILKGVLSGQAAVPKKAARQIGKLVELWLFSSFQISSLLFQIRTFHWFRNRDSETARVPPIKNQSETNGFPALVATATRRPTRLQYGLNPFNVKKCRFTDLPGWAIRSMFFADGGQCPLVRVQ